MEWSRHSDKDIQYKGNTIYGRFHRRTSDIFLDSYDKLYIRVQVYPKGSNRTGVPKWIKWEELKKYVDQKKRYP